MRSQLSGYKMKNKFLGTTVILPVKNVVDTARFYEDKLGFTIHGIWDEPPYGVVKRGEVVIEFGDGRKEYAGTGVCLIHVTQVDDIHEEFKSSDIEFVGDLADRDYGNRDFRIRDNNGNILIISSPVAVDYNEEDELIA